MIKREFEQIRRHKGLWVTMIAIILIPFVYSFCFLTSAWDPYGNTGKIPVAVVNLDQPASLSGKKIQAGADTVKQLHDDDQLEWHFVSAKQAAQGLKDNKFYTVVTIPRDFSQDAATVLDPKPKQMKLTYQTNGSLNYVSEIISQVGADKLNSQIKEKVTTAFVNELFANINTIGKQLKTASNGAAQLKDGVVQYTGGVVQVDNGLTTLNGKVPELSSGVQQLADGGNTLNSKVNQGSPTLTNAVGQLTNGAGTLAGGLGQLNSKVPALAGGVDQLANGGAALHSGLGQLNGKVPALASGVNQLQAGSSVLYQGLGELNGKVPALADGVDQLADGGNSLYAGLGELNGKVPALADGVNQLATGGTSLYNGLGELNSKIPALSDGVVKLNDGGATLNTGLSQINGEVNGTTDDTDLVASVQKLTTGMNQLYQAVTTTSTDAAGTTYPAMTDGVQQLQDGLTALQSSTAQLPAGTAKLSAAMTKLQKTVMSQIGLFKTFYNDAKYPAVANMLGTGSGFDTEKKQLQANQTAADTTMQTAINAVDDPTQKAALEAAFKAEKTASGATQGKLNTAYMVLNTVKYNLTTADREATFNDATGENDPKGLLTAVSEINSGLTQVSTGLNTPQASGESTNKQTFAQGLAALVAGVKHLNANVPALVDGAQQLSDGLNKLNAKAPKLASGISALYSGSTQLSTGLGSLNQQVPALTTGVSQLYSGSDQLVGGLSQLKGQVPALTSGVAQLYTGSGQLVGGLSQLKGQVPALTSGVAQLYTGSGQLAGGLTQLKGQVPALTSGVSQLYTGSGQLNGGLSQLKGQVPALTSGVSQLFAGEQQEYAGLLTLNGQTPALSAGISQLSAGLNQLNGQVPALTSGVQQLKDGTKQLTANNDKLNAGSQQLADGLSDGYQQVAGQRLTKLTAKMFANPSQDVQQKYTNVQNYGAALAPYVLALALFIAIIIFNFAYPMKRTKDDDRTIGQWLGSKIIVGTIVAVAAALVEATLILLVGLPVAHIVGFYAMTILFALAAMYLTQMLNLAFNGVGLFIALGLLTLSGSGGLFPAETISPLYESTQKFLPMTYAINGYRDAISGGIANGTVLTSVIVLIVIAVLALVLMIPATMAQNRSAAKED
ncbi:YhgE/Pip family protein [Lacticaseibacillus baoqingensis]|uniref:YhgE/Pip family protein n=1 Tax=Lacticaseibacillus baoqingensis TaxID=2486013 RepID=A0ABW4E2M2_9LACO|nr:YhgE/Pip domain-containing protein [Lacticaseibacillus baoqingensis]